MAEYFLYVNGSKACNDIELQLKEHGVSFVRVPYETCGSVLPALTGPAGVFEGTANIQLYFLDRKPKVAGWRHSLD